MRHRDNATPDATEHRDAPSIHDTTPTPERALIIAVQLSGTDDAELHSSARELERLANTLGIEVLGFHSQRRSSGKSAKLLGSGKLEEVAHAIEELGITRVLFDGELTPRQHENLEDALGVKVTDRSGVVLRIFEERAQTRQAQLEVDIARIEYELPRVRRGHVADDRRGGGGRGEKGHTNVELARQRLRERLVTLRRELTDLQQHAATQRARRSSAFQVALVGYTNAGKSSLMRALTSSEVLVEDKLFATLGTTARKLDPPLQPEVVVSDTVGFIKRLPHELVASFKSTLDEAHDADLLLYVLDASDPEWPDHLQVTRETIQDIGANPHSRVVFNKVDRLDDAERASLRMRMPDALQVSAMRPELVALLHAEIARIQETSFVEESLLIPFELGHVVGAVHEGARVVEQHHGPRGTALKVRAPAHAIPLWRAELPDPPVFDDADSLLERAADFGLELMMDDGDESLESGFDESGADYRVLHAIDQEGDSWILRTPRRLGLYEPARIEARALRALSDELPVELPRWALHTPEIIAYRRLQGRPGWQISPAGALTWNHIDPQDPSETFLRSVARTIAAMHRLPGDELRAAGIPQRTPHQERDHLKAMLPRALSVLKPAPEVRERWERWLAADHLWAWTPKLVHGDLHPGHLLLDERGQLSGIIDWSEAHLGDPAIDLSFFVGAFAPGTLERLRDLLDEEGAEPGFALVERCRERWAYYAVITTDWALDNDHDQALAHARNLTKSLESAE
ncbi:GTPase HflX [Lujinxingia vulgaris]|uniref:GTPase HflX n=1 Tax=Lujinxingia vulgaris TaxID=2600176 RepID=A0A5C6XH45_9DELT|nr:GTPase HflX [Lujinxingia vulgaris]TXD36528.1 GTPase HflX [Lujinxingia vulgaris]